MPKINVDTAYFNHPKTSRLKVYCGEEADIFPIRLWCFCAQYFPKDGVLKGYSEPEIEGVLGWKGIKGNLIRGLVTTGFIEKVSENYQIHDWKEHAGFIERYRAHASRMSRNRWKKQRESNHATSIPTRNATSNAIELNGIELNKRERHSDSPVGASPPPPKPSGPTPENLMDLWNSTAHQNLPRVAIMTSRRRMHIKLRLSEHPEKQFWEDLVARVNRSPMLRGENGRDWKCSFDWILNVNNMAKILEGNYDATKR